MTAEKRISRLAGGLYLVVVLTGIFSLAYVPSQLSGHGDVAVTVGKSAASEPLFRFGIAAFLIEQVAFLLLPLVLFRLLRPVDPLDLSQWAFFVLPASVLDERCPTQKTINLAGLLRLKPAETDYDGLAQVVASLERPPVSQPAASGDETVGPLRSVLSSASPCPPHQRRDTFRV